jgi:hypothetical protein
MTASLITLAQSASLSDALWLCLLGATIMGLAVVAGVFVSYLRARKAHAPNPNQHIYIEAERQSRMIWEGRPEHHRKRPK